MGWLSCGSMSALFLRHLQKTGPISVKAAANRYWRRHEKGYCNSDEDHKDNALMAMEMAAHFYAENGIIEPTNRYCGFPLEMYLPECTNITAEEIEYFVHTASVEEFNNLILLVKLWDNDGWWTWFDPIVWKLTDASRNNPELLRPFEGVDL
jgi:hypothetical protein